MFASLGKSSRPKTLLVILLSALLLVFFPVSSEGQIRIPLGNDRTGHITVGPGGIHIHTPDQITEQQEVRPGSNINIPFPRIPDRPVRPPRPNYPQQVRPQVVRPVQPVPTQTVTPAVPSNVVNPKITPPQNGFNLMADPSVTDAQQATEAAQMGGTLDAGLQSEVDALGDPAASLEWAKLIQNGSRPEDIEAFINDHGGKLNGRAQALLDLRLDVAQYQQDLQTGGLTFEQKVARIEQIQQGLDNAATTAGISPVYVQTLQQNVDAMDKFNTLGQITSITTGNPDQLPILVGAVQDGGLPISVVSQIVGLPVVPADPVNDVSDTQGRPLVVLSNPESNGGDVNYLLDSHEFTMQPGQKQFLNRSYTVRFEPGPGVAAKAYKLTEGSFEWRLTSTWDLRRVTHTVTIDNSFMASDFNFLLDNQKQVVPAGSAMTHDSDMPVQVVFDRGDGGPPARKLLLSGVYVVGLDASQSRLDLFEESDALAAIPQSGTVRATETQQQQIQSLLERMKSGK